MREETNTESQAPLTAEEADLIAGLVDGTLSVEERSEVLQLLARSEAARDALADVKALDALERGRQAPSNSGPAADPSPALAATVLPLQRKRSSAKIWIPLAAAAAVVLLLTVPRMSTPVPGSYGAVLQIVERDLPAAALLRAEDLGWARAGWATLRGPDDDLPAGRRAFRLGVRLTDLGAVLGDPQPDDRDLVVRDLAALLEGLEGGGGTALQALNGLAGGSSNARWADIAAQIGTRVDGAPEFEAGLLVEEIRLKAMAGVPVEPLAERDLAGVAQRLGAGPGARAVEELARAVSLRTGDLRSLAQHAIELIG